MEFMSYGAAQRHAICQTLLRFPFLFTDRSGFVFLEGFKIRRHLSGEAGGNSESSRCQNASFVLAPRRCHAVDFSTLFLAELTGEAGSD